MTTGLPRNVREQDAHADELHRQQYGSNNRNPEDEPPGEPDESAVQVHDPEPPADPGSNAPAPDDKGEDYWQQRFNVLQGKYNSEVRQMADENRDLKARNERSEQRLNELEQTLREQRDNQPVDLKQHFSEEELDAFGEETLNLVYRTANRLSDDKVAQVRDELRGDVEQVRQTQQQTQDERFWDALEQAVPDYATINDDPRFHQWLAQSVDVHTPQGMQQQTRQALLESYQQQGNARGVASLFTQFKAAGTGGQSDPREQREVPPRTSGAPAQQTAPQGGEWFTNDDIQAHYNDHRWQRKDPEGWRAREQEIERAVAAGRIK